MIVWSEDELLRQPHCVAYRALMTDDLDKCSLVCFTSQCWVLMSFMVASVICALHASQIKREINQWKGIANLLQLFICTKLCVSIPLMHKSETTQPYVHNETGFLSKITRHASLWSITWTLDCWCRWIVGWVLKLFVLCFQSVVIGHIWLHKPQKRWVAVLLFRSVNGHAQNVCACAWIGIFHPNHSYKWTMTD